MKVADHTITRKPQHPNHTTLGSENTPGDDYLLYIDGAEIGTTYYCPDRYARDNERWASDGPAGLSFGHRTREDAEQAQIDAHLANTAQDTPWEQALTEARTTGVARASDAALMANFCKYNVPHLVGAVAPQLVWEGAQKKGLTTRQLATLCQHDVMAVDALQWI